MFYYSSRDLTFTNIFPSTQDYFFWFERPLSSNASFLCESPQLSIGCLREPGGAGYNGTAARGESGSPCLPWSTPGLQEVFAGQSRWAHNHCRNPDGSEEAPICFIEEDTYDYCQIPECEAIRRREASRYKKESLWFLLLLLLN